MENKVLQITITKVKLPKLKILRYMYLNIWFRFWNIWRPKMLAKFYEFATLLMLSLLSKEKRELVIKELNEEIDIIIKDKTNELEL
jgi:hypothetical protein